MIVVFWSSVLTKCLVYLPKCVASLFLTYSRERKDFYVLTVRIYWYLEAPAFHEVRCLVFRLLCPKLVVECETIYQRFRSDLVGSLILSGLLFRNNCYSWYLLSKDTNHGLNELKDGLFHCLEVSSSTIRDSLVEWNWKAHITTACGGNQMECIEYCWGLLSEDMSIGVQTVTEY